MRVGAFCRVHAGYGDDAVGAESRRWTVYEHQVELGTGVDLIKLIASWSRPVKPDHLVPMSIG